MDPVSIGIGFAIGLVIGLLINVMARFKYPS